MISTAYISAWELARLKMIEEMLDTYYNRGGFSHTIAYLIEAVGEGAFRLYEKLADFYYASGFQHRERKKDDQYRILLQFARTLAQERDEPAIEETALKMLTRDAEQSMNPENLKRFLRKGWEITR